MNELENTGIKPISKTHPIFNTLVVKLILSIGLSVYAYQTQSPYAREFLFGGDRSLMYLSQFLMFIFLMLVLTFAESLLMLAFGAIRWVFKKITALMVKG